MLVLGVRLLFLAWRNRTLAELLLGLAFVFGGGLGAAVEASAQAVAEQVQKAAALIAVGKGFALVGMLSNCLFTWWVFRRHDRRGLAIIAVVMGLQIAGFAGHASSDLFRTAIADPLRPSMA